MKLKSKAYAAGEKTLEFIGDYFPKAAYNLQDKYDVHMRRAERKILEIERDVNKVLSILEKTDIANRRTIVEPKLLALTNLSYLLENGALSDDPKLYERLQYIGNAIAGNIQTSGSGVKNASARIIVEHDVLNALGPDALDASGTSKLASSVDALHALVIDCGTLQKNITKLKVGDNTLNEKTIADDLAKLDINLLEEQVSKLIIAREVLKMDREVRAMVKLGDLNGATGVARDYHKQYKNEVKGREFDGYIKLANKAEDDNERTRLLVNAAQLSVDANLGFKHTYKFKKMVVPDIARLLAGTAGDRDNAVKIALGFNLNKKEIEGFVDAGFSSNGLLANALSGRVNMVQEIIDAQALEVERLLDENTKHMVLFRKIGKKRLEQLNASNIKLQTMCYAIEDDLDDLGIKDAVGMKLREININMQKFAEDLTAKSGKKYIAKVARGGEIRRRASDFIKAYDMGEDGEGFKFAVGSRVEKDLETQFGYYKKNGVNVEELIDDIARLKDARLRASIDVHSILTPSPDAQQQPAQAEEEVVDAPFEVVGTTIEQLPAP